MSGCEPMVFHDVSDAMLLRLSESAKSTFGVSLEGDQGTTAAMGATLNWNYNRPKQSNQCF